MEKYNFQLDGDTLWVTKTTNIANYGFPIDFKYIEKDQLLELIGVLSGIYANKIGFNVKNEQ